MSNAAPGTEAWLDVTPPHRLFYRLYGAGQGVPVVAIHGGPGSGTREDVASLFDSGRYRLIAYDQRGAGRSRPGGCLEHNTTDDLVADLERLRRHLGVPRWLLFAGSWGVVLALQYARQFPQRVLGAVLRGVFLARRDDVEWFFGAGGVARRRPVAYRALRAALPGGARGAALVRHYARRLAGDDATDARAAAAAWLGWESAVISGRDAGAKAPVPTPAQVEAARIASHYAANDYFLGEAGVALDLGVLAGIPCRIVHGRHDLVCRPQCAELLHAAWPGSTLDLVDGGHVSSDPAIARGLREALAQP